jgi:hypothetical protein
VGELKQSTQYFFGENSRKIQPAWLKNWESFESLIKSLYFILGNGLWFDGKEISHNSKHFWDLKRC